MKLQNIKNITLITILIILFSISIKAIPEILNVQGKATSTDGTALTGSHNLTFTLYDAATGGTLLWNEPQSISLSNGIYDAVLGETNPINNLSFDSQYYLALKVDTDSEMTPRINLTTSPYSFHSKTSENLSCTNCILEGLTNFRNNVTFADNLTVDGNTFYIDSPSNKIGILTTSPTTELNVIGDVNITGGLNLSKFTSCTALETDSIGNLVCGTDDTNTFSGWDSNLAWINESNTFTGTDVFNIIQAEDWTNVSLTESQISDLQTYLLASAITDYFNSTQLNASYARLDADNDFAEIVHFTKNVTFADNLTVDGSTFYIDASSNKIGIGTTSPQQLLHVSGVGNSGMFLVNATSTGQDSGIGIEEAGTARGYVYWDTSESAIALHGGTDVSLNLNADGATKMHINGTTGSIGIGTTSPDITAPSKKLHVVGPTRVFDSGNTKGWDIMGSLTVGLVTNSPAIYARGETDAFIGVDGIHSLHLGTNGCTYIVIDGAGNVGIGTATPANLLNVDGVGNFTGDLYVGGDNMTHPDYVFEKDYTLLELSKLQLYIEENQELPPSPYQGHFILEAQSNNLLQQQYYLLEKIEELTLYILQQEKRIQNLESTPNPPCPQSKNNRPPPPWD